MNTEIKNIRETFGVIDGRTGKLYEDIISYTLETAYFSDIKLAPNSVYWSAISPICYDLHMDSKLKNKLREQGLVKVIISLQRRTNGDFAEARIWRDSNPENNLNNLKEI